MKTLDAKIESELSDLMIKAGAASAALSAAIKDQAKKIEVAPGVLRKYLVARLAGDLDSLLTESEQLEELVNGVRKAKR